MASEYWGFGVLGASLHDPVLIEVNSKYKTVDTLQQNYLFKPAVHKEVYLVYLLT